MSTPPQVTKDAVIKFFERQNVLHLCPRDAGRQAGAASAFNTVLNTVPADGVAARSSALAPLDIQVQALAGPPALAHCTKDKTTNKLSYAPHALDLVFSARDRTYAMAISAAASMAFAMHGATIAHGDPLTGPSTPLEWVRDSMARMPADTVASAVEVICRSILLSYLCMAESIVLPCISDIAALTQRQAADEALVAALNADLCTAVLGLFQYSIAATMVAARRTTTLSDETFDAINSHLTDRIALYLEWRYNTAPVCARGARALIAAICCPEPAVCAWMCADLPPCARVPDHAVQSIAIGDGHTAPITGADYQRALIAVSVAELFVDDTALPLRAAAQADHDAVAEACAALLVQRRMAMDTVATQFLARQSVVALFDAEQFTHHRAAASFSPDAALAVLRDATPLGALLGTSGEYVTRNLCAPGLRSAAVAINAPVAVTYSRAVPQHTDCVLASRRREFVKTHNEALARQPQRGPPVSCLAGGWPTANFTNVRLSKFGSRGGAARATESDAAAGDGSPPAMAPPLCAVPCVAMPALAAPAAGPVLVCRFNPVADPDAAQRTLAFYAGAFEAHAERAQDPLPDVAAGGKRAAGAHGGKAGHVTARALLAALVYWYNFCQSGMPALSCSKATLGSLSVAIETRLLADGAQHGRRSWRVNDRSPLLAICLNMSARGYEPREIATTNVPILHRSAPAQN